MSETGQKDFKDVSERIKIMGIIQIIFGSLAGFLALFVIFSSLSISSFQNVIITNSTDIISNVLMYGVISMFFIWTGLGAVFYHRWIRPVILSIMVPAFIVGIFTFTFLASSLPGNMDNFNAFWTGKFSSIIKVSTIMDSLIFAFLIYIVIPFVHILVYRSRNVSLTCLQNDTKERWTDGLPVQLTAIVIWLVLVSLLVIKSVFYGYFPFFGIILTGLSAVIVILIFIGLLLYSAFLVYRKKETGWWLTLALTFLAASSAVITILTVPVSVYYTFGVVSESQQQLTGGFGHMFNTIIIAVLGLSLLVFLYLIFVKRFFNKIEDSS